MFNPFKNDHFTYQSYTLKRILTIFFIFISSQTFSQANYSKIGIGFQAGLTTAYTGLSYDNNSTAPNPDALKSLSLNKSKTFGGSLDYNITPFLSAGVEYN